MAVNPTTGLEDPNYQAPTATTGLISPATQTATETPIPVENRIPLNVTQPTTTTTAATDTTPATTTTTPATYQATSVTPAKWEVTAPQTVSGQIQGLIAGNSPLMQQAETRAKQEANARGLLSSSMAVGAGQEAVMRQAFPIASQDANTYGAAAEYEANAANKAAMFNAELGAGASKSAAEAINAIGMENLNTQNQKDLDILGAKLDIATTSGENKTSILTNFTGTVNGIVNNPEISGDSPGNYQVPDTQVPPRWQVGDPMPSPKDNLIATALSAAINSLDFLTDIDELGIDNILQTGGTATTTTPSVTTETTPTGGTAQKEPVPEVIPQVIPTSSIAPTTISTAAGQSKWSSYLNTLPPEISSRLAPYINIKNASDWDSAKEIIIQSNKFNPKAQKLGVEALGPRPLQ